MAAKPKERIGGLTAIVVDPAVTEFRRRAARNRAAMTNRQRYDAARKRVRTDCPGWLIDHLDAIAADSQSRAGVAQIDSVIETGDGNRLAQFSGSVGQRPLPHPRTASRLDQLEPSLDLSATNQNRLRAVRPDGHHVEAAVETIDEIDVGVARLAPHGLGAWCATASEGMAGGILDPEVSLHLCQAESNHPVRVCANQQLAQKLTRHDLGGTLVEVTLEHWRV